MRSIEIADGDARAPSSPSVARSSRASLTVLAPGASHAMWIELELAR